MVCISSVFYSTTLDVPSSVVPLLFPLLFLQTQMADPGTEVTMHTNILIYFIITAYFKNQSEKLFQETEQLLGLTESLLDAIHESKADLVHDIVCYLHLYHLAPSSLSLMIP